jgi:hypothetical protein
MNPQEIESARRRSVLVAQNIAIYQPAEQYFVPTISYRPRGGWIAPDLPLLSPPAGAIPPVQAPPVEYRNLKLVSGGNPLPVRTPRKREMVQAPPIETV